MLHTWIPSSDEAIERHRRCILLTFVLRFCDPYPNRRNIGPNASPNQSWWPRGTIYLVMRVSGGVVGAASGIVRSSSGAMWRRKGAQLVVGAAW